MRENDITETKIWNIIENDEMHFYLNVQLNGDEDLVFTLVEPFKSIEVASEYANKLVQHFIGDLNYHGDFILIED